MLVVSAHAWAELRQVAGQGLASLTFTITAQKQADRKLHLEKSLHGLLARKLAVRQAGAAPIQ